MRKIKLIAKKSLSLLLSATVVISGLSVCTNKTVMAEENGEVTDYGLSNPKIAYNYRETVTFGNYWQEDTNGDKVADQNDDKTPIRWQILEKYDDDTALVVSEKILDAKVYNDICTTVTWATSTVRTWLNDEFYNNAFSDSDKDAIINADVINDDNPECGTEGGEDTKDNVFLLSINDVKNTDYGFAGSWDTCDQGRKSKVTAYAKNNGVDTNTDGTGQWWLRSPGDYLMSATLVLQNGRAFYLGYDVDGKDYDTDDGVKYSLRGIRPALRINLLSSSVKSGESVKVSVKGSEWDTVTFGKNEGKAITWRVLDVNGDYAFLVSDKLLSVQSYNNDNTSITWKDSTIRKWLNGDFINRSFTDAEKKMITTSKVINRDNEYYGTKGGEDTVDKVFLLSLNDIIQPGYGFPDQYIVESETRVARNSNGGAGWWWLRSPGKTTDSAVDAYSNGCVNVDGRSVGYIDGEAVDFGVIRPALYINLKNTSTWKKGEKVIAGNPTGGKEEPVVNPTSIPDPSLEPIEDETEKPTEKKTEAPSVSPSKSDTVKAPSKAVITKARNVKGKKLNIKWKKLDGVKGYEVQYSLNKKFKKAKTKTTTKTTFTIKKLKKKKTYYVRVRAYTIDYKGNKKYGKWSNVKKVKIKK